MIIARNQIWAPKSSAQERTWALNCQILVLSFWGRANFNANWNIWWNLGQLWHFTINLLLILHMCCSWLKWTLIYQNKISQHSYFLKNYFLFKRRKLILFFEVYTSEQNILPIHIFIFPRNLLLVQREEVNFVVEV